MYDYDKILDESLDKLFDEDFDKVNEKKELKLGLTLLNVPKITNDEKRKKKNSTFNNEVSKLKKEFLCFSLLIIVFLALFLGAYPTISNDIFYKEKAVVVNNDKIEYICDIITTGELKTTGSGSCFISGNNIKMKSSFKSLDDSINYMLIITNNGSKTININKYRSINKTEQMKVSYKMFYSNKEITSDKVVEKEKVAIAPKESLIIIINQKYNSEYALDFSELEYNINIDF